MLPSKGHQKHTDAQTKEIEKTSSFWASSQQVMGRSERYNATELRTDTTLDLREKERERERASQRKGSRNRVSTVCVCVCGLMATFCTKKDGFANEAKNQDSMSMTSKTWSARCAIDKPNTPMAMM